MTETKLFEFYGKILSGTEIMKPLWKRAISKIENYLGMVIGKMFVSKYFSQKAKLKVIEMIKFIKHELKKSIESWKPTTNCEGS